MTKSPTMLVVTTDRDLSITLFQDPKSVELVKPINLSYMSSDAELTGMANEDFDYVYFRDPFNDEKVEQNHARSIINRVLEQYASAYKVDGLSSYTDMFFEDKWEQYKAFSKYMPKTDLLSADNSINMSSKIIKKRISARSKHVYFSTNDLPDGANEEDYIIQTRLNITKEYRVYMVGGEIIRPVAVKSSKTPQSKVKLTALENNVSTDIEAICNVVYSVRPYDLMGIDIAKTDQGIVLLEVNRSCQFRAFYRLSGLNLSTMLNKYLLSKTLKEEHQSIA